MPVLGVYLTFCVLKGNKNDSASFRRRFILNDCLGGSKKREDLPSATMRTNLLEIIIFFSWTRIRYDKLKNLIFSSSHSQWKEFLLCKFFITSNIPCYLSVGSLLTIRHAMCIILHLSYAERKIQTRVSGYKKGKDLIWCCMLFMPFV